MGVAAGPFRPGPFFLSYTSFGLRSTTTYHHQKVVSGQWSVADMLYRDTQLRRSSHSPLQCEPEWLI